MSLAHASAIQELQERVAALEARLAKHEGECLAAAAAADDPAPRGNDTSKKRRGPE